MHQAIEPRPKRRLFDFSTEVGTVKQSGQTCWQTGMWRPLAAMGPDTPIARGQRFPRFGGQKVGWVLVRKHI